jgi:5-methylcytosine-specific restriction endonuclease McrA
MQDIPFPPRKTPRVFKERSCADCETTFLPRTATSLHCPDCQKERKVVLQAAAAVRRAAGTNKRYCEDCGVELPPCRGRPPKRCVECRETYWQDFDRARNKERTESGTRKAYDARYRRDSAEQVRAASQKYRKAHPETDLAAIHRRRQRGSQGLDALDRLLSRLYRVAIHHDPCFYCGGPGQEDDHFFPLFKGGTDHWWNLVRACRVCNRAKMVTCGTAFMLADRESAAA